LSANVYLFPLPGVPPFGPGLQPATNALGRLRDWLIRTMMLREFGKGTAAFNETRRALGLGPLPHPFEQLTRLASHLVLTSAAFDFASTRPPAQLVYAGPELEDPAWTQPWRSPFAASDRRPLVLVGFSTTFQNQLDVLRRVVAALDGLDVRAVVTAGPAVDIASLPAPPNVHVCASAPHSQLLKEAAAVVTHAGHGTVIRALAAGVPMVCLPMGRDQNENAARVVFHGAGVRVKPTASAAKIRQAVRDVLDTSRYRECARRLGKAIADDARDSRAVSVLETVECRR
jgi:MGT family glycosyltransferase